MTATPHRLMGVQLLRLIAALMVVLQHTRYYTGKAYGVDDKAFFSLELGETGVFIFFVISGYVIGRQVGIAPARFATHRLLRIYPAHFTAIALATLMLLAIGTIGLSDVRFDLSLALLPIGALQEWSRVPYWTLIFEVYFYAVAFTLMLGGRRLFDAGLCIWAAALIAISVAHPFVPNAIPNAEGLVTSLWALLFIGGAALARAHAGNSVPLAIIAAFAFATAYKLPDAALAHILACTAATAAVVHVAVTVERFFANRTFAKPIAALGDWSYGLYLIHAPVLVVCASLLPLTFIPHSVGWPLALAIAILTGLSFGRLEHRAYVTLLRPLGDRLALHKRDSLSHAIDADLPTGVGIVLAPLVAIDRAGRRAADRQIDLSLCDCARCDLQERGGDRGRGDAH